MSINQEYSKIFNNWEVTEEINSGSYGKVFKMQRNEDGVSYSSALKVITIPQNDNEIKAKRAERESWESISTYYQGVTKELLNEIKIMAEFRGNSNIVSYEDHQVIRHEDGIGCDIFIRMELLTSFIDYMSSNEINEKDIIRLGIDICKALEICEKKNIIHRDIKPGNIFVSSTGDFKLGDFGIARTIEKTIGGLSTKGTPRYMAPEVYNRKPYGKTVDICSLGLVMYYLANGKRTPFLPDAPVPVTHDDEENALDRRMRGERIMPPKFVSNGLAAIILKACSYDSKDRYANATQLRHDLEALTAGRPVTAQKPESELDETASAWNISTDANLQYENNIIRESGSNIHKNKRQTSNTNKAKPSRKDVNSKKNWKIVIPAIVASIVIFVIIAIAFAFIGNDKDRITEENNVSIPEDVDMFNGNCYKIINTPMTWDEANEACKRGGGHLATITSEEEQEFIESLIIKKGTQWHYWLGATDRYEEGKWQWVTGEDWVYSNWGKGQPNNKSYLNPEHGQDYMEIKATKETKGSGDYLTWTDTYFDGISYDDQYDYRKAPDYDSTEYYGYICEWENVEEIR